MYDEYEYPKNLLNHTIGYSTSLKGGERNKTSKYPNPKSKIEKNIYCFFGVSWYQYQYQGTGTGYWGLGWYIIHNKLSFKAQDSYNTAPIHDLIFTSKRTHSVSYYCIQK